MALIGNSAGLLFKIDADSSGVKRELAAVDGSISSLGGKMSTLGGAATVAAAGIAAIGAAALTAGKFLFDLTVTSAEYGSKIFDAAEKTGLATETLSAMSFAADQSGTSLESVTAATAKFSKAVATAGEDAKKSAEFLKDFGVSPQEAMNDLDGALGKVFERIVNAREGVEQMSLAQKAFGKSGAELLPFIKSFDGDLTALTRKAKDLGVTLSKEDAKAADDFGDTLDTLKSQAAGVGRAFTGPLMRDITMAMGDVSSSLSKNQSAVKEWGEAVATTLRGLKNISTEIYNFAQTPVGRALKVLLFGGMMALNNVVGAFAGPGSPQGGAPIDNLIPGYDPLNKTRTSNAGGGDDDQAAAAKKAAEDRAKEREAAFQRELSARSKQTSLLLAGQRTAFSTANADWEKAFLAGEATKEQFRDAALKNLDDYVKQVEALLVYQRDLELKGKVGTERDNVNMQYSQASAALNREVAKEREDVEATITGAVKKQNDERVQSNKEANAETLADAKAVTARLISDFETMFAKKLITERTYNEAVFLLKLRELELERSLTDDARERFRIDQEIKILRNEAAIEGIELAEQELEAANAVTEAIRQQNLEWENLFAIVSGEGDISPFQTIIDGWNGIVNAMAESAPGMTDIVDMMANAFSGMANAIGNVVQQYVMYGKTAPGIMRQVLAQALAAIAAEAAMRAVYALAMGFFFLATHQYVDATNAFISAAIFGSIAVGAALIGRAIAPKQEAQSSFNNQASTSTSSGGNSGQGSAGKAGAYSGQEDRTIDASRNAPGRSPMRIDIGLKLDSNGVLEVIKDSVRTKGMMRDLIVEAGY